MPPFAIDLIHTCPISHNASFKTEMCISVLIGVLWDMEQVYCGICAIGLVCFHKIWGEGT